MPLLGTGRIAPGDFNLPYDDWRPYQYETMCWIRERQGALFVQAPTGSGKTAYPASLPGRVLSLVKTKALQEDNYGPLGFTVMKGAGNYSCILDETPPNARADKCIHSKRLQACPVYHDCEYVLARQAFESARLCSANYALWFTSSWMRSQGYDLVTLDEAHLLPNLTMDYAGLRIDERTRKKFGLPAFPAVSHGGGSMLIETPDPLDQIYTWVGAAVEHVSSREGVLSLRHGDSVTKSLLLSLKATLEALPYGQSAWYTALIREGGGALIAMPMTAKYHFPLYFAGRENLLFMSATMNPDVLAPSLGIAPFEEYSVPSVWPAEARPVYLLDAPKMGKKAGPKDYDEQARVIAEAIGAVDPSWSGVVHVTRKAEAELLSRRLNRHGLAGRAVAAPQLGTDAQVEWWIQQKKRKPNSICVVWSWWEGVDLGDDEICIVAKVPFGNLSTEYDRLKQRYDAKLYLQMAAWDLEQALGRTRRGRPSDYDTDGQRAGLVAIADGNWKRIQKYLGRDLLDSLVDWS